VKDFAFQAYKYDIHVLVNMTSWTYTAVAATKIYQISLCLVHLEQLTVTRT